MYFIHSFCVWEAQFTNVLINLYYNLLHKPFYLIYIWKRIRATVQNEFLQAVE